MRTQHCVPDFRPCGKGIALTIHFYAYLFENVHIQSARKEDQVRCLHGTKVDGPAVTHLPLPVVDVDRPWGSSSCKGFCAGHYLVKMIDTTDQSALQSSAPPSQELKNDFSKLATYPPPETFIQEESFADNDTKIWMDHLHTVLLNHR